MASIGGDDGSDADSVPDDVFQRSSSAVADAEEEFQYAQDPLDDGLGVPQQLLQHSDEEVDEGQNDRGLESEQISSDEDDDRENRFDGPASTWRFYTESERALAASLDQEQANDLSKHLYNAHALKARLRHPQVASRSEHHHGKKHWIKANEDGMLPWHPDAHWTAWPLRPDDVPRRGETFGATVPSREQEKMTYSMAASWKPSADLKEEIHAIMLKEAKERLQNRERERQSAMRIAVHGLAKRPSPRKRKRSSSESSSDTSSSSQSQEDLNHSHSDRQDGDAQQDEEEYEILVDEEDAREILQPSIHNIVLKLDDLMAGLHKSRRGHIKEPTSPHSRAKYETRRSRSRAKSKARTDDEDASPASDEFASPNGDSDDPVSRPGSASAAPSTAARDSTLPAGKVKRNRKPSLSPRDWSEVLGIASLVGWNPAVVQRAAHRCSELFGENMTFHQKGPKNHAEGASDDQAAPEFVVVEEEDRQEEGFACPVESCPRHREPWPLNKTWRWREHLKRSHKFSKGDIEKVEAGLRGMKEEGAAVPSVDIEACKVVEED